MTPQVNFHNWGARPLFFGPFFSHAKRSSIGWCEKVTIYALDPRFVSIHPKMCRMRQENWGLFSTCEKSSRAIHKLVCFPTKNLFFQSVVSQGFAELTSLFLPITIDRSISTKTGNVFLWKMGKIHSHANSQSCSYG